MSVFTQNNIVDVFVASDVTKTTVTNTTSDVAATLANGQITVMGFDPIQGVEKIMKATFGGSTPGAAGTSAPDNTNCPYIRFVQKIGNEVYFGSKIYGKDLIAVSQRAYNAPTEQTWYVGYDGSNSLSDLDISQAGEFILTIAYDHDDMMWSEQKLRNSYDYYEPSPSKRNLAKQMCEMINYKERLGSINGTGAMVKAEIMNNAAAAVTTTLGTSATVTVTNGSDIVLVTAPQPWTGSISVGTLLRFASDATSEPVYFVSETNNTASAVNGLPAYSLRLSMPYQGSTATGVDMTGGSGKGGIIPTASVGANWGIKITGLPLTFKKDFFKYNKVKFHFDLKGFGASTVTKSAESKKGSGWWQEVAEWESFAAGNQGILNRTVVPLPTGRTITEGLNSAITTYNTWYIESKDSNNSSPIVGNAGMRIQTMMFFPDTTAGDNNQTYMAAATGHGLSNWLTKWGFSGIGVSAI